VKLGAVEGEVVGVSLRRTTLRDDRGGVHTIPNGSITVTSNLTEVGDAS
jgi:small-conductance mechanosensitive channel